MCAVRGCEEGLCRHICLEAAVVPLPPGKGASAQDYATGRGASAQDASAQDSTLGQGASAQESALGRGASACVSSGHFVVALRRRLDAVAPAYPDKR